MVCAPHHRREVLAAPAGSDLGARIRHRLLSGARDTLAASDEALAPRRCVAQRSASIPPRAGDGPGDGREAGIGRLVPDIAVWNDSDSVPFAISGSRPPKARSWICQQRNRAMRSLETSCARGCEARRGRAAARGRSRPRSPRDQMFGEACRSRRFVTRLAFAFRRDIVRDNAIDALFAVLLGDKHQAELLAHHRR
jgi:hypothetical protein